MKTLRLLICVSAILLISACSSGEGQGDPPQSRTPPRSGGEHVWKEQTATIEKAKEAEQIIQNAADLERKQTEEQAQ